MGSRYLISGVNIGMLREMHRIGDTAGVLLMLKGIEDAHHVGNSNNDITDDINRLTNTWTARMDGT